MMAPRNPSWGRTDVRKFEHGSIVTAQIDILKAAFLAFLAEQKDACVKSFAGALAADAAVRPLEPARIACARHLDRAAAIAPPETRSVVRALAEAQGAVRWGQTYTQADFGPRFMENYGWVEMFGTRGHFVCEAAAAGFLVLGPGILYPDHHHEAEEIYIPLAGAAEWRKAGGPYVVRQTGEIIYHPSNVGHAMRTGDESLVALYMWRGGPLAARSTIAARPESQ